MNPSSHEGTDEENAQLPGVPLHQNPGSSSDSDSDDPDDAALLPEPQASTSAAPAALGSKVAKSNLKRNRRNRKNKKLKKLLERFANIQKPSRKDRTGLSRGQRKKLNMKKKVLGCCICRPERPTMSFDCGHIFCQNCLQRVADARPQPFNLDSDILPCPFCGKESVAKPIIP